MSTPNDSTTRGQRGHAVAGVPEIPREEPAQAERVQTEHAVRTAATMAAQLEGGSLPRAVVDYIVASSDFRQNRQALEARAASIANHVVNDVRAPNFSGAHPNDVAAYLTSIGRQFGDYRRYMVLASAADDAGRQGGSTSGGSKSAAYSREFGGDTYNALARHGYKPEHIHSAIGFARDMGTSEEMAKKFIKLDHGSRDRVRGFVEQIESDPSLTPEQKQEKIRQFRGQNPKIGKHLTNEDLNKILQDRAHKRAELRGDQEATAEDAHQRKLEGQREAGIQSRVEASRNAVVASLNARPDVSSAEDDELAAIAARRRVAQSQSEPAASKQQGETPAAAVIPNMRAEVTAPAMIPKQPDPKSASASTAPVKAANSTSATVPKPA